MTVDRGDWGTEHKNINQRAVAESVGESLEKVQKSLSQLAVSTGGTYSENDLEVVCDRNTANWAKCIAFTTSKAKLHANFGEERYIRTLPTGGKTIRVHYKVNK